MPGPPEPLRIALAASPGGHIDLLIALRGAVEGEERIWVLPGGARRDALAATGERTAVVRLFGSHPRRLLGNLRDAGSSLRRVRPDIVVTSGAGVVVPYCLLARALGARVVFMETMARVSTGSRAGRVLSRIADATLVQWPESRRVYPRARVCAPALLVPRPDPARPDPADPRPALASQPPSPRAGTLVALGTHWQPFGRLMQMVDRAARAGVLPAPVTAQVGEFTYPHEAIRSIPSLPPERLEGLIRGSEVVVCHGGAGIIATALRAGRRPLVLARRAAEGEHIDDHQRELVDKLAELGLLTRLQAEITEQDVRSAAEDLSGRLPLPGEDMESALAAILGELGRNLRLARRR